MLCQECNNNQASLHFTKILNGKKTEIHLCEHCAREKGEYIEGSNGFSIHQLLSGLLNFEQPFSNSQTLGSQAGLECKKCGMSYNQFAKSGRFGCAECYETFETRLDPILRRVHGGNTKHIGKIPKRIGSDLQLNRDIEITKKLLQQHILNEEFEETAKLRDQIRLLEKKAKQSRGDN